MAKQPKFVNKVAVVVDGEIKTIYSVPDWYIFTQLDQYTKN